MNLKVQLVRIVNITAFQSDNETTESDSTTFPSSNLHFDADIVKKYEDHSVNFHNIDDPILRAK